MAVHDEGPGSHRCPAPRDFCSSSANWKNPEPHFFLCASWLYFVRLFFLLLLVSTTILDWFIHVKKKTDENIDQYRLCRIANSRWVASRQIKRNDYRRVVNDRHILVTLPLSYSLYSPPRILRLPEIHQEIEHKCDFFRTCQNEMRSHASRTWT